MEKKSFKWINFLHFFDVFAVPFSPSLSLKSKQTHHSSALGGFISLIVYFLSIYYGVSLMVQWMNNQMVLKVQQSQGSYLDDVYQNYFYDKDNITHLEFQAFSNIEDGPDPFKKDEILMIPLLIDVYQFKVKNLIEFHNETEKKLSVDWKNNLLNSYIKIIFVQCIGNEGFLKKNQTCGSQEKADEYFNQEGLELHLLLNLQSINFNTEEVNKSIGYTISFIQKEFSADKVITLQYSYYEISKAVLFESPNNNLFVTSFTVRDQMSTRQYLTGNIHYFLPDINSVIAAFTIGSNSVINHTIIQSPSLSEVLAQIGSILQTLLLIRYVIQYINSRLMYTKFKGFFLSIFFPDLKQVQQKGKGRNTKYYLNSKQIDQKSFQQFKKRIDELIEEKLNYANLIYEIAKMQAVLEEISTHYHIYHSHQKKCDIILQLIQKPNIYKVMNLWNLRDNNINGTFQSKLYPFAFNYSLSKQCLNFCQSFDMDQIDTNPSKTQTKSQLIMRLDMSKI